jgi:hypothetical protein
MQLPLDAVAALLRACAATGDLELTCDELLEVLAAHVEGAEAASAGDGGRALALAGAHLRLCGSCRQESEALAALIREDSPGPPGAR